ncbi:MAG: hypothetical protein ORN54_14515 [Cyclobacteriaceae bacterium]|nr:hypothetical protein [Cyclobacteriaceae bacterium]
MLLVASSCSISPQKEKIDWDKLIKKYSLKKADTLHLASVHFLKENIRGLTSEKAIFYDVRTGKEQDFVVDTTGNESSFIRFLEANHLRFKTTLVNDEDILTTEQLENNIEAAVSQWRRYPWNRAMSKEMFLKYLLPYKISQEFPEEWRSFFQRKYEVIANKYKTMYDTSLMYKKYYRDPNELHYTIIVNQVGSWFKVQDNCLSLTTHAGLTEIMALKKGNCHPESHLNAYIMRSLGIPSTIDVVPFWGSRNGSHSTEVFMDTLGTMRTAGGRKLKFPAKVLRMTFEKANLWSDSIKPFTGGHFLLENLKNERWLDVTHEHTKTTDIVFSFPSKTSASFAYICVNNYNNWIPIYWGKVKDDQAIFRNMGRQMLYRVAIPDGTGFSYTGSVFMIDSLGALSCKVPNAKKLQPLALQKLNDGRLSWVKKNEDYSLYILDDRSNWQLFGTHLCVSDSVIFFNEIPSNAIYRLVKKGEYEMLARPFTYEKGKQIWW